MRAIQTALHAMSSLGLTGAAFGLPLGLFLTSNLFYTPPEEVITTADDRTVELASWVLPTPSPMSIDTPDAGANEDTSAASDDRTTQGTRAADAPALPPVLDRVVTRPGAAVPAEAVAATNKKSRRKCEGDNPAIERTSGGVYAVERALVEGYAKHPRALDRLGWVSRHDGPEGKADGFKLGGLSCGNDLHEAGLRNGDVIHSVNGRKVSSIPQALLAYAALRKAPVLEVLITRKGAQRTLTYHVG